MKDKKLFIVACVLLVIILVCLLVLSKIYITENRKISEEQRVMIEASGWPIQEVPLLNKPNLELTKFSPEKQIQEIKKGVSFEEFVEYLYELCDAGFEADSFYGCKHPSMLSSSINPDTIEELTWLGRSQEYRITATWKKEGTSDRISNFYVSLRRQSDVTAQTEQ